MVGYYVSLLYHVYSFWSCCHNSSSVGISVVFFSSVPLDMPGTCYVICGRFLSACPCILWILLLRGTESRITSLLFWTLASFLIFLVQNPPIPPWRWPAIGGKCNTNVPFHLRCVASALAWGLLFQLAKGLGMLFFGAILSFQFVVLPYLLDGRIGWHVVM